MIRVLRGESGAVAVAVAIATVEVMGREAMG